MFLLLGCACGVLDVLSVDMWCDEVCVDCRQDASASHAIGSGCGGLYDGHSSVVAYHVFNSPVDGTPAQLRQDQTVAVGEGSSRRLSADARTSKSLVAVH